MVEVDEPLLEQGRDHSCEEIDVATRPNRKVHVGRGRGLGSTRVDRNDPPASCPQLVGPAPEVGNAPHAAVRHHGVGADDHEEIGAVDVGNGDRVEVAEHPTDGELLRHLVEGGCGEHVGRPERHGQLEDVEDEAGAMHGRVADHQPARGRAERLSDRTEATSHLGERLLEGNLNEDTVALHQRQPESIRVGLQLLQRGALRTQETPAERVGTIATDQRHLAVGHRDVKST